MLMATQADVRRMALSLPAAEEAPDRFAFSVRNKGKLKGFVWVWMERVAARKPRVPQPNVIAVRVANLVDKDLILSLDRKKFFTEPHYDGFPAVLARLPAVGARTVVGKARIPPRARKKPSPEPPYDESPPSRGPCPPVPAGELEPLITE